MIYAPAGYSATVTATPATVLGTAHADLQALAISPDAIIQADGQIIAADPAGQPQQRVRPEFTPPSGSCGSPSAARPSTCPFTWTRSFRQRPLAGAAPFRMIMCFSSPYVGAESGGAPFGAKIVGAELKLNQGTLRTPTSRGTYTWRAIVTPYAVGGALPNAAGTDEAHGIVRTPNILSISGKVLNRKLRRVRVTGLVRNGDTNLPLVPVTLARGGKPTGKAPDNLGATTRKMTTPNDNVAFNLRFSREGTVYFQLSTTTAPRDVTSVGCVATTTGAPQCVSATLSAISVYSRVVRLKL